MIQVSFLTLKSGELVGFWIQGHSGYAEEGSDIVCAAVSSAAYMTANTILEVLGISADVTAEDGDMSCLLYTSWVWRRQSSRQKI